MTKARILIVEDEGIVAMDLRSQLHAAGHVVVATVVTAEEAIEAAVTFSPDLVLMDIKLAGKMDGVEAACVIRERCHIPVIFLTAHTDEATLHRAKVAGPYGYIPKPLSERELRIGIEMALHTHQAERRADVLLHVILPPSIAAELKEHHHVKPQRHANVGILFCDVVGFGGYCDTHPPEEALGHLQTLIIAFEEISANHGLEKIKTVGDAFMATAGLLTPCENPALACVRAGLEMVRAAQLLPCAWNVHVGIHLGPVVAGVLGQRKYLFDVWGDTVNTAARLCTLAGPTSVYVSQQVWHAVQAQCQGQEFGLVQVKGKGAMEVYGVNSAA